MSKSSKPVSNQPKTNDGVSRPVSEPVSEAIAIPSEWPGSINALRLIKPYIKPMFWTIFMVYVLFNVIQIVVVLVLRKAAVTGDIVNLAITALSYGVGIPLYLAALKGGDKTIGAALDKSVTKLLAMVAVLFISGVIIFISLLLLVVPFIFIFPRIIFAPYLLIDKDMGVGEAISTSWNTTRGHIGKIWLVMLLGVAFEALAITIIGIPFAIYLTVMNYGSLTLLYLFLFSDNSTKALS